MTRAIGVTVLALCASASGPAMARLIEVRPGPGGARRIQAAIDGAARRDVILVRGGVYAPANCTETIPPGGHMVEITTPGLTLKAAPGEVAVLDAKDRIATCLLVKAADTVIDGLHMRNAFTQGTIGAVYMTRADNSVVRNCRISACVGKALVYLRGSSNVTIERNYLVSHYTDLGIRSISGKKGHRFVSNVIMVNGMFFDGSPLGIYHSQSPDGHTIVGNYLYSSDATEGRRAGRGMKIRDHLASTVSYNVIEGFGRKGLEMMDSYKDNGSESHILHNNVIVDASVGIEFSQQQNDDVRNTIFVRCKEPLAHYSGNCAGNRVDYCLTDRCGRLKPVRGVVLGEHNRENVDAGFVGRGPKPQAFYALRPGSAALTAGQGGRRCGVYGLAGSRCEYASLPRADYERRPQISRIEAGNDTGTEMIIRWHTDQVSDTLVEYGPTRGYGQRVHVPLPTDGHKVILDGLTPGTRYYFRASSTNPAGKRAISAPHVFTTAVTRDFRHNEKVSLLGRRNDIDVTVNVAADPAEAWKACMLMKADDLDLDVDQGYWLNGTELAVQFNGENGGVTEFRPQQIDKRLVRRGENVLKFKKRATSTSGYLIHYTGLRLVYRQEAGPIARPVGRSRSPGDARGGASAEAAQTPADRPTPENATAAKAAAARLRRQIIEASRKGTTRSVYVDGAGGGAMRALLFGADENGVTVRARGMDIPIAWSKLSPKRFYGIATKYSEDHDALHRYCLGSGLVEEAERERQLK